MIPAISLILPAYNEARVIPVTIAEAVRYFESRGLSYQIVVAADGTDGTREIVRQMAATNPALNATGADARRGKGLGIRVDVAIATGAIIGYADADNKVPIDDFDVRPVLAAGVDMAIGRGRAAVIEKAQPLYCRVGSVGFHWFIPWSASQAFRQCGFKFSSTRCRGVVPAAEDRWLHVDGKYWPSRGAWATASSSCPSAGVTTPTAASTW
jgi:dolichyl-phosphate beta-glucosyltransferase